MQKDNSLLREGYGELIVELDAAFTQAAHGKGAERHANDLPFVEQPLFKITQQVGLGFPTGQAIKKLTEALGMVERGEMAAAVNELRGAIVYTAAAAIYIRENQK